MLTTEERARLDPRVVVESLEELLRQLPVASRAVALNSFYAQPDPDVMTIVGMTDPEFEQLWLRAWGRAEDHQSDPY
jgi:hypothetical protein